VSVFDCSISVQDVDISTRRHACDVSYALSDIQAADTVKLKIYANSTRRALWHARLGFHHNCQPPIMSLHSLFADGGPVPGVDVVIVRIYPIQVCAKLYCR